MFRDRSSRLVVLLPVVLAVCVLWAADPGLRAAASEPMGVSATSIGSAGQDKAAAGATAKTDRAPRPSLRRRRAPPRSRRKRSTRRPRPLRSRPADPRQTPPHHRRPNLKRSRTV